MPKTHQKKAGGSTPRRRPARRTKAAGLPEIASRVTVRHYCQGIGDCHLLSFPKADGGKFWMLIDCGVHSSVTGGANKIRAIVEDIVLQTKRIDVLVVTHEHIDHVSGFLSAVEGFAKLTVDTVWMGWTEDPKDPQAQKIDRFKTQALAALTSASRKLDGLASASPHQDALRRGLDGLLGFHFGVKGERVREARDAAVALAPGKIHYWDPGEPPVTLAELPGLRIYALGPPRDEQMIHLEERASEMYGLGGPGGWSAVAALSNAFFGAQASDNTEFDGESPFDPNVGSDLAQLLATTPGTTPPGVDQAIADFARDHYYGPSAAASLAIRSHQPKKSAPDPNERDQSWRRIDLEWLGLSADLAMQLDQGVNNTSLALAFEFTDSGRVLLFAADAQVGSWLSWQDAHWEIDGKKITGPDLLARTVYYKVGHHGSHNGTLRGKGLELMTQPDLSAFIATNEADAIKVGWGQMPYHLILDALKIRCGGRVMRADSPWVAQAGVQPDFTYPAGSIQQLRWQQNLWVEVELA